VLKSLLPTPRAQAHVLLLLLLTLLFGLVEIPMPMGPDQGILCHVANDILDGGVPYRTTWDHKPPGAHYLLALGFRVLGRGATPLRLFDLVYVFLIVAALYRLGSQLFGREAGFWGGILFLITYYTRLDWWNKCQPDEYMLLPLLVSLTIVLDDPRDKWWRTSLAGACLGAAFVVKLVALVAVVPILFWYLRRRAGHERPRPVLQDLGLFLGGFVVPNLILVLWLWWHRALGDFLEAVFYFNLYYSQLGRHSIWELGSMMASVWLMTLLVAWVGVVLLWRSGFTRALVSGLSAGAGGVVFAFVVLGAFFLEMVLQGKGYGYHQIPLLLGICLLAGLGLQLVSRATHIAATRFAPALTGLAVLPAILLAICMFLPFQRYARYQAYKLVAACALLDGVIEREIYYRTVGGWTPDSPFNYVACRRVAQYVQDHTEPTDSVYVWGFDPVVNVLAGRRMPTRFSYNTPLVVPWRKEAWREEFMNDLRQDPPRYLLVMTRDQHPWTTGRSQDSYQIMTEDFLDLARFVADRYELETTILRYKVYRRR
jgi:4-amino-4-deoxy-L-arabinose transferase-like glycosyltransferase